MNRTLRGVHRLAIPALAVAAPAALVTAIAVRTPIPAMALPAALATATAPPGDTPSEKGPGFQVRATDGGLVVALTEPLAVPDPLLYWTPELPTGSSLPDGAVLLGPLSGDAVQIFASPPPGGAIVLFSLGHGDVAGAVRRP